MSSKTRVQARGTEICGQVELVISWPKNVQKMLAWCIVRDATGANSLSESRLLHLDELGYELIVDPYTPSDHPLLQWLFIMIYRQQTLRKQRYQRLEEEDDKIAFAFADNLVSHDVFLNLQSTADLETLLPSKNPCRNMSWPNSFPSDVKVMHDRLITAGLGALPLPNPIVGLIAFYLI